MRWFLAIFLSLMLPAAALAQNTGGANGPAPEVTQNGDWFVACREITLDGQKTKSCEMQQTMEEKSSGKPFVRLLIGYLPNDKQPRLRILAPLGVILTQGMVMQIDQGKKLRLPFQVCLGNPAACIIEGTMENDIIEAMKKGSAGRLEMVMIGNRKVEVPFSLQGFTKSINSLR